MKQVFPKGFKGRRQWERGIFGITYSCLWFCGNIIQVPSISRCQNIL